MINFSSLNIFKKTFVKNSLILFTGQTISSLLNMLISVIVVRKLGFEKYGIIALGLSYISIFNILFNFQSFNAVIKFGHEAIANNNEKLLKSYLKQAFFQDFIAAILSFTISIVLLNSIVEYFKWGQIVKETIYILSFSTLFNITGSIVGLLRLFNKFNYISIISVITAMLKLILIIIGLFLNTDYFYYVIIELISLILINILNDLAGLKILINNKLLDFLFIKTSWDKNFLKFNLYNNLITTLDLPVGEFTKIFINQFLGTSELGIYNILVKVGNLVNKLTGPISIVMFPELAKNIANRNEKKAFRFTKNVAIISFGIGSIFIFGQFILYPLWSAYIFNNNINRFTVLIYFIYVVFCASVTSIHQFFIALNLVKYNIPIIFFTNMAYVIITPILMKQFGLIGLITSLIMQAFVVVILKTILLSKKWIILNS